MGKRRASSVPVVVAGFNAALSELGVAFRRTASFLHPVSKGSTREASVADFLRTRLPGRFSVASGHCVDLFRKEGPQLDAMIFDSNRDFPLHVGPPDFLAAEALLASVEVKSVLTFHEIEKCVRSARKLRSIKPFKKPLAGPGDPTLNDGSARYFHSVFSFDSNIDKSDRAKKILDKFQNEAGASTPVDQVYLLDFGLIDLRSKMFLPESPDSGRALVAFYFSILNFLQREGGRRLQTPYVQYATEIYKAWERI